MADLGVGELVYLGEIYDKMNDFLSDFEYYRTWCGKRAGPVLELCCGTGRLTLPLKKSGLDIMGLDITDTMLATARQKAAREHLTIDFVHGDIRTFDLGRRFSTIFIPFNSLQHTYTLPDLEAVLARVKKHLEPKGFFLFDVFNPSIHLMVDRERTLTESFRFTLDDGREVVVHEKCDYDAATQTNRVKWFFRIGNEERTEKLDMRCFYPLEMDALLKYNGLAIEQKFGGYDESPFTSTSPKQIFVCRVA